MAAQHKLGATDQRLIAGETVDRDQRAGFERDFHRALISACGSRRLMRAHGAAFDKYLRYQMIAARGPARRDPADHADLAQAAMTRDAGRARALQSPDIR